MDDVFTAQVRKLEVVKRRFEIRRIDVVEQRQHEAEFRDAACVGIEIDAEDGFLEKLPKLSVVWVWSRRGTPAR